MEVEKVFVSNFLSKPKGELGKLAAFTALTVCIILSHLYWNFPPIAEYLSASPKNVFDQGEYWRLFTTSFIHGDMDHLLSNSLMLFILTYFVSSYYGLKMAPVLSFIMGAFINFLTITLYDKNITLVGASGVVYYLWGFWLVLYIGIERQLSLIRRLLRVGAIFFILLVPTSYSPQTSYTAHFIGLGVGLIVGLFYFFLNKNKLRESENYTYKEIVEFEITEEPMDDPLIQ
jgi:rhomboid protease GluP